MITAAKAARGPATARAQVVVIAKEPVPGRVKTRLTPPFSPGQAARLAAAALADTLAAAAQVPAVRHVLALDGTPGTWLPPVFDVVAQQGRGLDERLAAAFGLAFAQLPVPVVLIGMDTPQVTPGMLEAAIRPLAAGTADAVFGPADDGGFWLLGLRRPDPELLLGVPMSAADTGEAQLARLTGAGLRVRCLPMCTDVDDVATARAVAVQVPRSRFAAALRPMLAGLAAQDAGGRVAVPVCGPEPGLGPYDCVTAPAKCFR
ncbi:MAG: TIGR04282 family arsenosugar biosynthesis glycosyltransferase [Streptosporangiaceae bacterium]